MEGTLNSIILKLTDEEQITLTNQLIDRLSKTGIIKKAKLVEAYGAEEFRQDNHYSNVILNREVKLDPKTDKRAKILMTAEDDQTPMKVIFHGEECWIKKGELDLIKDKNNIDMSAIKVLAYVEGLMSPYQKSGMGGTPIDAYEIHILY
jgi:hypothetical protein